MSIPSTARSRAWVDVDLGALQDNLRAVRDAAGPGAAVLPMVKADAYGLGVRAVVPALVSALAPEGPWALGVAAVAEGEALRADGWGGRIVVFSPVPPGEFARAARAGLALCLSDVEQVRRWAAEARARGARLPFHLEVDTGMGRAGFPWRDAAGWAPAVREVAGDLLAWDGCFTHFHSADAPDPAPADEQQRRFQRALDALPPPAEGGPRPLVHSANSAAALRRGGYGGALVRPGIFLYGGDAGADVHPRPVVAVRARIALVRDAAPGDTVGYGAEHAATAPARWGTLSIGYGDGIPRALWPGRGEALVRGRRVPVIGRISMDATVVDLTAVPGAAPGDVATLVGRDGGEEITLDEMAARCGTISYEILTGLGRRLPRVHAGAG